MPPVSTRLRRFGHLLLDLQILWLALRAAKRGRSLRGGGQRLPLRNRDGLNEMRVRPGLLHDMRWPVGTRRHVPVVAHGRLAADRDQIAGLHQAGRRRLPDRAAEADKVGALGTLDPFGTLQAFGAIGFVLPFVFFIGTR